MNLLKTSVRKRDTEEDVEWRSVMHWASTGQPLFQQHESPDQAADADSSESEVEEMLDPQTTKPKGITDNQRQKEQEKAERELRKHEEARERQRKKEEKEKQKKAKEDERANRKRKEKEDKLAMVATTASPSQKKKAVGGSRLPCNVVSGLAYPRATARATARDWRPHVPLDHDRCWTITSMQPLT